MDGVSNGKPFFEMGWFGGKTHYFSDTSLYIWVAKKNPPLSTQPATWILQNALKAFFFLRFVQAGEVRSRTSEALTAMCWGPSWGSIRPTASRPLELSMKTEDRVGGPRRVALGHRFPRAKFQWMMDAPFFQSWFTVYRWFCLGHLKISKSSQIKIIIKHYQKTSETSWSSEILYDFVPSQRFPGTVVFPQWSVLGSSQDSIQLIHLLHLIWNSFQILDGNENAENRTTLFGTWYTYINWFYEFFTKDQAQLSFGLTDSAPHLVIIVRHHGPAKIWETRSKSSKRLSDQM